MHYPTLLLALFTTAALAKDPWVRSYYHADCTGTPANDKASINEDNCVKFDSTYDAVAVNFGSGFSEIDSISVFTDDNCMNFAGDAITARMADGTPQQCVSQMRNGAKWGSVQKTTNVER